MDNAYTDTAVHAERALSVHALTEDVDNSAKYTADNDHSEDDENELDLSIHTICRIRNKFNAQRGLEK